jgi:phosphocarrier protein
MAEETVIIANPMGLHARPAALLARTAAQFDCGIKLTKQGVTVNAKSIMGILMLAAEQGAEITIQTSGEREREALEAVKNILSRPFTEE